MFTRGRFALIFSLSAAALVTPVKADSVFITAEYAQLYQSDGITGIGAGKIGILVADEGITAGIINPFDTVLSLGSYLGGTSDDRIVGITTSLLNVAGTGGNGFQDDFSFTYSGNFTAGDKLYLLWFPTISTIGSTVGAGVSYGVYRSDDPNTASAGPTPTAIGFIAPSVGSYNMSAYLGSIATGSPVTIVDFTASQITAVPEPSAYSLLGVAALGMALVTRRLRRARRAP